MTQAAGASEAIETAAAEDRAEHGGPQLGQLLLYRHARAAGPAARRDVRDLCLLPRRRRHRRWRGPASRTARRPRALARRYRRASMPASRRPASAGSPPRPSASAWRGRISSPSSTAWKWMSSRISGPRISPTSISIAIASPAPWAAFRSGSSASARRRGATSPMSSAAPCSSPISCATSMRMPRSAGSICRARPSSDAGIAARDPAAVLADPALDRACAVVAARARGHFAAAGAIIARCPRRATLAPRLMAKVYRHILERMTRQGWRAPRQRVKIGRARAYLDASRRQILLMPRPSSISSAPGSPGLPRPSASPKTAPRSSCMRRRITPAGAAAPITSRRWIR